MELCLCFGYFKALAMISFDVIFNWYTISISEEL